MTDSQTNYGTQRGTERVAVEELPTRTRRQPHGQVTSFSVGPGSIGQQPEIKFDERQAEIAAKEGQLIARSEALAQAGATLRAVSMVLAVRLQLLLSLIGAFVLAVFAMAWQSPAGLYVMIAWCLLTLLPLVWLEFAGRPRGR